MRSAGQTQSTQPSQNSIKGCEDRLLNKLSPSQRARVKDNQQPKELKSVAQHILDSRNPLPFAKLTKEQPKSSQAEENKKARMDTTDSLSMPQKTEDIKLSTPVKKNFGNVIKLQKIPQTSTEKKLQTILQPIDALKSSPLKKTTSSLQKSQPKNLSHTPSAGQLSELKQFKQRQSPMAQQNQVSAFKLNQHSFDESQTKK